MMIELLTSRYPGMRLWLSQRLTALMMVIYIVTLIVALLIVQPKDYLAWHAFANCWVFKLATGLFFICLTMHAWLGIRDVLRDYVFNKTLRSYLQVIVDLLLAVYLIWLTMILCNS